MRYGPIAYTMPQYEDYPNYWMKAYEQGTTTALSMATDITGDTTAAKFEINTNGFPVTAGAALVIPYIGEAYDLWLFPTEALADANDTTNAIQIADNVIATGSGSAAQGLTVAAMTADTGILEDDWIETQGYNASGDNGGGTYKIKTVAQAAIDGDVIDEYVHHSIAGGLYVAILQIKDVLNVSQFGVTCDGVTDDTNAMKAVAVYTNNNSPSTITFSNNAKVLLTDVVQFKQTLKVVGNQAQIYQSVTGKGCLIFGDDLSGGGNYRNALIIDELRCGNVDKTATCIEYRNINNSAIRNVYAVGGAIGHHLRGCILSQWEGLYASTQIAAVPDFFGTVGGIDEGILLESYEGLACNENTFIRPWGLGCAVSGMDVSGANNTIIGHDFEGISSPADHLILNGKTNVFGGDIEGSGGGIIVNSGASYSMITGINCLSFVKINTGCKGVKLSESIVKYPVIDAGSSNCIVENVKVSTGGTFVGIQAGTNNIVQNITNASSSEIGLNQSGTFSPVLHLGGASDATTYTQQTGSWVIDQSRLFFTFWLQVNVLGAGTGLLSIDISGIPFLPKSEAYEIPASVVVNGFTTTAGATIAGDVSSSLNSVRIREINSGTLTNLTETAVAAGSQIRCSGFYFIK